MIVDLPDNVMASVSSLIGNVSGSGKAAITVLITPEEVDQATVLANERMAAYRPPGEE